MTIALLHSALVEAACEGRLVQGLADCAKVLQSDPDDLMVCVLPEDSVNSNVTLDIQTILIESICLEVGIPVIRVDAGQIQPLQSLFLEDEFKDLKAYWGIDGSSPILQLDCFIIQRKDGAESDKEKKFMNLLQAAEDDGYREFPE